MWYCRRKRLDEDDEKPGRFNPARDSVLEPAFKPPKDGDQSPAQILSMNDPAAWTEAYSAAFPQQLDSHSIRRVEPEASHTGVSTRDHADDAVSGLSGLSSNHDESRNTILSTDSRMGLSPIMGGFPGEEDSAETVLKPSPLMTNNRRSLQTPVELPG